jgi:hypothetical protein
MPGTDKLVESIKLIGIPYRVIKKDDDLSAALSNGYVR